MSGAVALDDAGRVTAVGDSRAQAFAAFAGVAAALGGVGLALTDTVLTRIYLTPETDWKAVAGAYHETFAEIRPAATMVRVHGLALPGLLLEVEAVAVDRVAAEQCGWTGGERR